MSAQANPGHSALREQVADALRHNDDCGPGPVSWGEYLADADALLVLIAGAADGPKGTDLMAELEKSLLRIERDRLRVENERYRNVEQAARRLDALFDPKDQGPLAKPGGEDEWMLDGRRQTFAVSMALLSLHDHLNARPASDDGGAA